MVFLPVPQMAEQRSRCGRQCFATLDHAKSQLPVADRCGGAGTASTGMTPDIALILGIDGIATGSIYVLVGLGLVLIFSVTRVVFVPFGDIVAFSALTLASLQLGRMPGTVYLVATLGGASPALSIAVHHWRRGEPRSHRAAACSATAFCRCCRRRSLGSSPARACRPGRRSRSPSRLSCRSRR